MDSPIEIIYMIGRFVFWVAVALTIVVGAVIGLVWLVGYGLTKARKQK